MLSTLFADPGRWRSLVLGAALLMPLTIGTIPAHAAPQVRVVGCTSGSLDDRFTGKSVAALPEGDDESASDEQQPAIQGSISLPGVNEDDSAAIAAAISAKGLTTIAPEVATDAAKGALVDAAKRKFKTPKLETENAQAVWSIETSFIDKTNGGSNPSLEVKVDAGSGGILSVECD